MNEFWLILSFCLMLISPSIHCPNKCICLEKTELGVVIDCSKLGIVTFPPDSTYEESEQHQIEFDEIDLSQNELIQADFSWKYRNVGRINLAYNEIATMKNVTVSDVKSLKELNLSHNKRLEKLTMDLKSTSLEILTIRNCSITEIEEGFLDSFPSLKFMDISQNSLSEIGVFIPFKPENLGSDEIFISLDREQFQLTHLNISHNQLIKIHGKSFRLTKVKIFDISNNKISHLTFTIYLPRLEELYASRNNLKNLDGLSAMNLILLDISGNKLKNIHFDFNINTPTLKSLIMSHNHFERITQIKSSSLLDLDISYSHIRIIEPKAFSSLHRLKSLNLIGNELTNVPGELFFELTNLKFLFLRENPWNCDCSSEEFRDIHNFVLFERKFSNGKDLHCRSDSNETWSTACGNHAQNDDFVISERGAFYTLLYIFSTLLILIILAVCYKYIMNMRQSAAITFDNDNGVVNDYSFQSPSFDDRSTMNDSFSPDHPPNFPTRRSTPPPNYEAALMLPALTEEQRELAISTLSLHHDSQ